VTDTFQTGSSTSTDLKDSAKEQVHNVAATSKDEATNVVETAKDQVQAVTSDLREQTRQLADEARTQLTDHALSQRDNAVESLRSLGDELSGMADRADAPGLGAQLNREVGDLAHRTADFLQEREPGQLVEELRELGRRRPGAFLLGAAAAGLLVGRVTRGAKTAHASGSTAGQTGDASGAAQGQSGLATDPSTVPSATPLETDSWGPTSPVYPGGGAGARPGGLQ
jgi:hypothetical protein